MEDLLFFDSETSGLDPDKCEILEMAAIRCRPDGAIVEEWATKIKPTKPVDPTAAAINGYTPEAWADAGPLKPALDKLLSLASGAILVAHNTAFDWGFIQAALGRRRWTGYGYRRGDTMQMAWPLWASGKVPDLKLQTLVAHFGIDPGEPHRALSDARACRDLYLRLMFPPAPPLHLPTASALDRALRCPASCVLDPVDTTSEDNTRGTLIHAFIARAREIGRDKALATVEDDEVRAECEGIDLDVLPVGAESEVGLAWDPHTGRAERSSPRGPGGYVEDGRLHGTADLVGRTSGGAFVLDFKTGALCTPAENAMQLRSLGLWAARMIGAEEADVVMAYLGHDGRWYLDRAHFDAFDLLEVEGQLRGIIASVKQAAEDRAAGRALRLHDGPWCRHCPAQRACPARVALIKTAAAGDMESLAQWDGATKEAIVERLSEQFKKMSPEGAGKAIDRLRLMAKFVECANDAAKDLARHLPEGVPLPGGRVLREVGHATWGSSDVAKAEIAALKSDLQDRGEIRRVMGSQVRVCKAR